MICFIIYISIINSGIINHTTDIITVTKTHKNMPREGNIWINLETEVSHHINQQKQKNDNNLFLELLKFSDKQENQAQQV